MKESEFWNKYNHCPYCREYIFQCICNECKWYLNGDKEKPDLFVPSEKYETIQDKENEVKE